VTSRVVEEAPMTRKGRVRRPGVNSLNGIRAEPASVRPFVRRTRPGIALAKTDGGANGGSLIGENPSALPIASSRSSQASGLFRAR
jgi:hypothetical protein